MSRQPQDDDRIIPLVELALATPPEERRRRLETACTGDSELFEEAWRCVQWELRMGDFLQSPLLGAAEPECPFGPGELLEDRFRITREVARGGMGVVYEAQDEKLDRRIAIKCAVSAYRKRLPPEARNATEISHPNVCKIFEIHTLLRNGEELEFLTMEFLDGETLAERLHRGPLPRKEAHAIAAQLCAGVAEAHRRKVIHGDLKSGNVIVTPAAGGGVRAVITDFGLACGPNPGRGMTFASVTGGTPDYMAPELWEGAKASIASDVYALGKILERLASGEEEGAPRSMGRRWARVVRRCTDPDPARRFRSAEDVAKALGPGRRRKFLAVAAALGVAALSGAVTLRMTTGPKESVRLAVAPLASDAGTAEASLTVNRAAAAAISRLKSSARTRFRAFSSGTKAPAGATHLLHGKWESDQGRLVLTACVTDARRGVDLKCRTGTYTAAEARYAAGALAGLVTESFHLPAAESVMVAAAAREDYGAGIDALRRNSGVERGLARLERAVQTDPDSPLTRAALAEAEWWMYKLTGNSRWMDRAAESIRQVLLRNPDIAEGRRIAGLLEAENGSYEQAEAEFLRSIELDPSNDDAYRRLATAYRANKQLDQAVAAYHRAIELGPVNYRNYQALGAYYSERGDYEEAARQFAKTVELAPEESSPHFVLGRTYLDLGRLPEAEQELRASLAIRETGEALNTLGVVLTYQGRDAQAIPLISRAVAISPSRYLWWMNLGGAYRRVRKPADSRRANLRALTLAEAEVEKNPRNGYARSCVAYVAAWLGQRRKAESEIAQSLRLSPYDADARWMIAHAHETLGNRDGALAALRDASAQQLADVNRHPDLAALRTDPRFQEMIRTHSPR